MLRLMCDITSIMFFATQFQADLQLCTSQKSGQEMQSAATSARSAGRPSCQCLKQEAMRRSGLQNTDSSSAHMRGSQWLQSQSIRDHYFDNPFLQYSTCMAVMTPLHDWSGLHSSTAWPAGIYQPSSVHKHALFSTKLSSKSATRLYRAVFWISSKPGNSAIDIPTKSPDQARGLCQTFNRQAYACEASFLSSF